MVDATGKLGDYVRLDTYQIYPAEFPMESFCHYSIPAFDSVGGPIVQYGAQIESGKFELRKPAVLVSKLNPRKLRVQFFVPASDIRSVASTEFMVYTDLRQDLDLRYLYHLLSSGTFTKRLQAVAMGTTNSHIRVKPSETLGWPVWIPPLEDQQSIADILNKIDGVIGSTEDIIVKYKGVRTGLASDLLDGRLKLQGDTGESQECRIGDLGSVVGGGTPSRDREEYWNGSIPWLTPGELTGVNDKFVSRSKERISELGLAASSARVVPAGSLLITSRASIGFCALAGVDLATNQGFQNLIPNADSVDSSFLYYLGQTLRNEMIRRASGTTFLEISKREFERIKVQIPPLKEQRRIAKVLDDFDYVIQANRKQLEKLRRLRAGLAADLFSGRVRTVKV